MLSLWTYDTAYYSQRPATWPIPWGQKEHAFELFEERDPGRFLAKLDHYRIDYLLVPLVGRPRRSTARTTRGASWSAWARWSEHAS